MTSSALIRISYNLSSIKFTYSSSVFINSYVQFSRCLLLFWLYSFNSDVLICLLFSVMEWKIRRDYISYILFALKYLTCRSVYNLIYQSIVPFVKVCVNVCSKLCLNY